MNTTINRPLPNIHDPFDHRIPPHVTAEHLAGPIPAFLYTLETQGSGQHQPPIKPTFYASILKASFPRRCHFNLQSIPPQDRHENEAPGFKTLSSTTSTQSKYQIISLPSQSLFQKLLLPLFLIFVARYRRVFLSVFLSFSAVLETHRMYHIITIDIPPISGPSKPMKQHWKSFIPL
ncbi:hypothetical protein BJ165DRAFT_1532896 [Panaeolus papilionaceus]|nr:hypothetical protein BJ165DRAFT_1532896 [Panaeolus papilionaceus]